MKSRNMKQTALAILAIAAFAVGCKPSAEPAGDPDRKATAEPFDKVKPETQAALPAMKHYAHAQQAEFVATKQGQWDVHGVLRVTNVMTVATPSARADEAVIERMDDAAISTRVQAALLQHRSTRSMTAKVETIAGVVTVSGIARNAPEKTLVTILATDISGVKRVVNNMTFAPAVSEHGVVPGRVSNLRVVSTSD